MIKSFELKEQSARQILLDTEKLQIKQKFHYEVLVKEKEQNETQIKSLLKQMDQKRENYQQEIQLI